MNSLCRAGDDLVGYFFDVELEGVENEGVAPLTYPVFQPLFNTATVYRVQQVMSRDRRITCGGLRWVKKKKLVAGGERTKTKQKEQKNRMVQGPSGQSTSIQVRREV